MVDPHSGHTTSARAALREEWDGNVGERGIVPTPESMDKEAKAETEREEVRKAVDATWASAKKMQEQAVATAASTSVRLARDQYEAELDFDIGRKYNVLGLGTACPTVFDEDTDMVAVARNVARFFKHESCGQCTPCREGSGWLYQLMCRIEEGDARTKDLDLALEIGTSMGSMPGTTICGLADGNNWSLRTIMNKFRGEFEARVRPSHVPVTVSIGATARG